MKRLIVAGLVVALLLAVAGGIAFKIASGTGSSSVEQWIGSQFQTIANSFLNPKLSFSDLDYQYPGTVTLKNMRLTADDPANPGKTIDIIGCDNATVTLAEIPSVGKPIVIEKIILDKPLFSAVAVAPNSKEFVGFSHLLRGGIPTTKPTADGGQTLRGPKLSEVFRMRLIQITDGKIVYDPRIAGTDAMSLDQINTQLNIEPAEPGWYKINTAIARKPVFDLSIAGQVNLDTFSGQDMSIKMVADLGQDKLDYLPPQIQQILKQYQIKGAMEVTIAGSMPLMQPTKGKVQADVKLIDANVTLGEYQIPINKLTLAARLEDEKLSLPSLHVDALNGSAEAIGSALLNEQLDSEMNLKITGMQLQELLAGRKEGTPLKMAGKLIANMQFAAPLKVVLAKASATTQTSEPPSPLAATTLPAKWGSATFNLTEAKLIHLPLIHDLSSKIAGATKLVVPDAAAKKLKTDEKVNVGIELSGDRANVTEFTYVGEVIAARGRGYVGLNRALDLTVNGGPVEKLQSLLGKEVGGILGKVTDNIVAYTVTGTVEQPHVGVEVGGGTFEGVTQTVGGGVEKVGQGVSKGIGSIGEGIGNILKPKENQGK